MAWYNYGFRPYVPVAQRRANAQREVAKLAKKGKAIRPIAIEGRTIARTFWGKAWCDNLESYSDYANRLPRGRTYVRNGSVVHLDVQAGRIEAMVSGSELYQIKINIAPVAKPKWRALCRECAGGIGSLVELLQGRLSDRVMSVITRRETGLFPAPKEIDLDCSCPDWADMCKHVAAVLYGVGARLDQNPELLFVLRSVNHEDLISQASSMTDLAAKTKAAGLELAESDLGDVFGIELDTPSVTAEPAPPETQRAAPRKARRLAPGTPNRKGTQTGKPKTIVQAKAKVKRKTKASAPAPIQGARTRGSVGSSVSRKSLPAQPSD